ncbi:site-specific integrase [Mycobacterium sp. SMC-4]|uniref:tyrosine-type recombinase/integrase n=1 Tax=Mycobacterium sp. SMC-4 TaxID=2857059 RepID=UPI0021B4C2E2|nr:tyrosine-type recombinase/integrase [Mycobacterium sp. SMC-4]
MDLYFADWQGVERLGLAAIELPRTRTVANGTPVIVDSAMRPVEPLCTFLRLYSENISHNSAYAYALDTLRFTRFLAKNNTDVLTADRADLLAYRKHRLASGLSTRSWSRELVVIRTLFKYLFETGQRKDLPWIRVGSRSLVTPKTTKTELDVRALSHEQWTAFRNIGMGGELPSGEFDPSYRGRSTVRNTCAAELALTTGMRLNEWRTLLDIEVPQNDRGVSLALAACAKNGRFRRVYVPVSTVEMVNLYRETERKSTVRRAQSLLRKRLPSMAIAEEIDTSAGRITYSYQGCRHRAKIVDIPVGIRSILVKQGPDGWVQPLSLFLGKMGRPPCARRWHQYFREANERLAAFDFGPPRMPSAVTTHDLRHTFAVVMLRGLQENAATIEATRPRTGTGTISEHIVHNPLLTLQRLLGHASPSTTMIYLRYIDESDELIQRAFESWADSERDYASYVMEQIGQEEHRDESA